MATNPEHLQIGLLLEHRLSIRQIEDLFFDQQCLPAFKNHLQQHLSYQIANYDFFWLDEAEQLLQKDDSGRIGKYYDWPALPMQKEYLRLEMDMPACKGVFAPNLCHLQFDWNWASFIEDKPLQSPLIQVGRELCECLQSSAFLLLPCEEGNDYVYYTYAATKAVVYLNCFQSIEEVVSWLVQAHIPAFDHNYPQINSFLLQHS